jgi:hypothetical protein
MANGLLTHRDKRSVKQMARNRRKSKLTNEQRHEREIGAMCQAF